ncbi:MAG: condensation domain-containing protein, partial [Beijerinckiaceae bacterium]|nr:condensation domain-containing protein [Beijerinckiaceae bacterium]
MTKPGGQALPARKLSGAKALLLEKRLRGEMSAPPARELIASRPPGPPPLSFAQLRLWFLDWLEPESPVYNIPAAFWLKGALDVTALEWSLNEIMRRHEVLRTGFPAINGEPIQVIAPDGHVNLAVENLTGLPKAERMARALDMAHEEVSHPFDLAKGPLIRIRLLRLTALPSQARDEFDCLIVVTLHHIVADGWSIDILVRELAALYPAFANGKSSPLSELPIQYADYAHWQRSWLDGGILESQLVYWRERLAGLDGLLHLPADRPRPDVQTNRGGVYRWHLPKSAVTRLEELGRREGVTLFMTLLAAFNVLLCRYSAQTGVCVGTPVANRNRLETEGVIGFFVNTLVLRTDL